MLGRLRVLLFVLGLLLPFAACGTDDGTTTSSSDPVAVEEQPTDGPGESRLKIVATTSVLGDIVSQVVGNQADVSVLIPVGGDPHDYRPSSAQTALLHEADLVVANGLLLEEGLLDVLDTARGDGANVFEVGEYLDPLPFGGGDGHEDEHDHDHEGEGEEAHEEDDHDHEGEGEEAHEEDDHDHEGEGEEAHEEDDHDHDHEGEGEEAHEEDDHDHDHEGEGEEAHEEDDHDHDHGSEDPHFWQDPQRVALAATLIGEQLAALDPDTDWTERAAAYASQLEDLDAEIAEILEVVPPEARKLVTNHDSLGYFAARYGFEVVDTVIPGVSTLAEPSSEEMATLVATIIEQGVPAVFSETIQSPVLAQAIADETGVVVVELYTGSLGEPGSPGETLIGMLRTNAQRIADALS